MVIAGLGPCFVSATYSLAAHKVMLVVPNLIQEHHVHHMDPYTNYIGRTGSHLRRPHDVLLSIIEVIHINHAYFGISYPS